MSRTQYYTSINVLSKEYTSLQSAKNFKYGLTSMYWMLRPPPSLFLYYQYLIYLTTREPVWMYIIPIWIDQQLSVYPEILE